MNNQEIAEEIATDGEAIAESQEKIPLIIKNDQFNPKIVDGEDFFAGEDFQISEKINEHMKLIDYDQDIQVFNGPKSEPRMTLDIKTLKQLGSGT